MKKMVEIPTRDTPQGLNRRDFLTTLSSAVAATLVIMPSVSLAASTTTGESVPIRPPDGSLATEEAFFAEFGRTFTIDHRDRYFTPAQKGSMPIPIMKRYKEGLD